MMADLPAGLTDEAFRTHASEVMERIETLAAISEDESGLTRVFASSEQRRASDLVLDWMRQAGMTAREDASGNVIGRYEGRAPGLPCLMLGSHLDSVRDAGKYDGPLGVLTPIACVAAIREGAMRLPFAIEVVGFADEEGVRFQSALLGSRAVAGTFDRAVLDRVDATGKTMAQAMLDYGLDPDRIGEAARRPEDVLAYVEYHIEQGPVLEAEGLPVGVVTAINGQTRLSVELKGTAGHAGTVPMRLRQDALCGAAEATLALEEICRNTENAVGTVGRVEVSPGAPNVIAGSVMFTVDIRAPGDDTRTGTVETFRGRLDEISGRRQLTAHVETVFESASCACAAWIQDQLGAAVRAEEHPLRMLPSGAGHDGMAMIDLTNIGMLFLRCEGGISHNPAEAITLADGETGLRVLLRFIVDFSPSE